MRNKNKKNYKNLIVLICIISIIASAFPGISFAQNQDEIDSGNVLQSDNCATIENESNIDEDILSENAVNGSIDEDVILSSDENEVVLAAIPGDVPTKNIYVFYDKPIANITNTGEGAIITKEDYFSGTSALKVKGNNWTGSSDAKIVFENSYDISSYLTNAKLSVKIKMPSNAVPSSGTNALQIDLYDINDVRRGYFINVTSADEWGEYTVSLNSQSAGWDTFDWTNLKWINIASRPQAYSSWYWYIDDLKIDLGLGDPTCEILDVKNGGLQITNNIIDSSKEIAFTFNTDIDEESLEKVKISVNGNDVNFTSQYLDKVYTINILDELLPYLKYKIDFSDVTNSMGIPIAEDDMEYTFYAPSDFRCDTITLDGTNSASAVVKRLTQNDKKPLLMVAKYNANGEMTVLVSDGFVSEMADEDMLYVELPNFSNDEYGYVFAIDDIKSMNLLCDAISIGTKAQIVTDEPFKVSGNEKFSYKDVYGLVTILKPAVSFSDLETVAYTSLSDYILNISPVKTNENGSFELTFIYNGTESSVGEKNTYFNVKNTIDNTSQTSLMPYFKTNTLNTYVDELKKITLQTDFVDKFNKCLEVFKFDKKYYDLLSDKDEMAKILFNIGFEDKESLLSTLQK